MIYGYKAFDSNMVEDSRKYDFFQSYHVDRTACLTDLSERCCPTTDLSMKMTMAPEDVYRAHFLLFDQGGLTRYAEVIATGPSIDSHGSIIFTDDLIVRNEVSFERYMQKIMWRTTPVILKKGMAYQIHDDHTCEIVSSDRSILHLFEQISVKSGILEIYSTEKLLIIVRNWKCGGEASFSVFTDRNCVILGDDCNIEFGTSYQVTQCVVRGRNNHVAAGRDAERVKIVEVMS